MVQNKVRQLVLVISIIFLATIHGSLGFSDEDWDWDEPEEEVQVKRWTKQGICDHDAMTSLLLKLILDVQGNMKVGDPALGIPPLDPLHIPKLDFETSGVKHRYGITGTLTSIKVSDLSTFDILDIKSDLTNMEANVSIVIDTVIVQGDYKMRGFVGSFPLWGNGKFQLNPRQVNVDVFSRFGYKNGTLELQMFDFKLKLGEISVKFNGLMGGGMSRTLNKILNSFGLQVFNKLEPKIHYEVRRRAFDDINKFIVDLKYDEVYIMEMLQIPMRCMFG